MTKDVGGYVGFTTDGVFSLDTPLSGMWNLFDHARYSRNSKWAISPVGVNASGTFVNSGNYFTFTGPGTLTVGPSSGVSIELLMVGGGGGGGWYTPSGNGGGGGGAGGLLYAPSIILPGPASYPVSVGAGGPRAPSPNGAYVAASGSPTTFNGLTALGGGAGGGYTSAGLSGGSGGTGAGGPQPGTQPGQAQPLPAPSYLQYGNPSGTGSSGSGAYDGGGGAGSPGANPTPTPGSAPTIGGTYGGGAGRQYPQFTPPNIGIPNMYPAPQQPIQNGYYAGGGAGGGYTNPGGAPWGSGIGGGGGSAIGPAPDNYYHAVANTGGGGAGGANGLYNGNGGSGIVIIRVI